MLPSIVIIAGGYGYTGLPLARCLLRFSPARVVIAGRRQQAAQGAVTKLVSELSSDVGVGVGVGGGSSSQAKDFAARVLGLQLDVMQRASLDRVLSRASSSSSSDVEAAWSRLQQLAADEGGEKKQTDAGPAPAPAVSASASGDRKQSEAHAILVNCAPVLAEGAAVLADACLAHGVDYLDVLLAGQRLPPLEARQEQMRAQGRVFVIEAGFHPGLVAALVRLAAARFGGNIQSARLCVSLNEHFAADSGGAGELLDAMRDARALRVFERGEWQWWGSREETFDAPVGRRDCYSFYVRELEPLPAQFPSLRDVGLYMASNGSVVSDYVVMPVLWLCALVMGRAMPFASSAFAWAFGLGVKPPYFVQLVLRAKGTHADAASSSSSSELVLRLKHARAYDLTAFAVAAYLLQWMAHTPSARTAGLVHMGQACEPEQLVQDLARFGCDCSSEEHSL